MTYSEIVVADKHPDDMISEIAEVLPSLTGQFISANDLRKLSYAGLHQMHRHAVGLSETLQKMWPN